MIIKPMDKFKGDLMCRNTQRIFEIDRNVCKGTYKKSINKLFDTNDFSDFIKIIEYELFYEEVYEDICKKLFYCVRDNKLTEEMFVDHYIEVGRDGFFKTFSTLDM